MATPKTLTRLLALTLAAGFLAGCGAGDRLKNVGRQPALSAINDPTAVAGYRPVQMPMPEVQPVVFNPNSLWQSGARGFFKDQRAARVGDILTVKVDITDRAQLANRTSRTRTNSEALAADNIFGLESAAKKVLPDEFDPSNAVTLGSDSTSEGSGAVNRQETVFTNVAAVITQQLPNGNLVIEGRQEVRINFEIRELIVAGIVRPEDIEADNTIMSTKIAEARIAYGGRGQITDVQQPRYGQQVLDIVLPF